MKKVLIITYYWPPSGGGGVQRWLKFTKYLPQFGWEPIIFTPENPDFDIKDESLVQDVDTNLEVLKLPIWEPYHLFKKLNKGKNLKQGLTTDSSKQSIINKLALFIRGNFFIPDPRKYWVKPSVEFLSKIIHDNAIDVVVTTGPPHSMHLIGLKLKKKLGVKWLADFRDPWSRWDMLQNFKMSSIAWWRHKSLEKQVLRNADAVVTVSKTWAKEFDEIFPRQYEVITNGYDEDDFKMPQRIESDEKFVISHFGLINKFRNPIKFWEALIEILNDNPKQQLQLNLFGTIESEIKDYLIHDDILKKVVNIKPPVSHEQVIKAYNQSDLLLLLLNDSDNAKGHIPGKLFEYMASGKQILGLGLQNGDCADILKNVGAGEVFNFTDKVAIKSYVLDQISTIKPKISNQKLTQYSRKKLTNDLVSVLNSLQH
jgi:glycosyltransferase involved in cell wall biosynthesis